MNSIGEVIPGAVKKGVDVSEHNGNNKLGGSKGRWCRICDHTDAAMEVIIQARMMISGYIMLRNASD